MASKCQRQCGGEQDGKPMARVGKRHVEKTPKELSGLTGSEIHGTSFVG